MSHVQGNPEPALTVRQGLHDAKTFSTKGLLLTVCGAIIGTAVPAFAGGGPAATLAGTVVLAVLTALGLTGADGTAKGVKAVATVLLAVGAVFVTVTGVTAADLLRGKSISGDTQTTFPVSSHSGSTPTKPNNGGGTGTTTSPHVTSSKPKPGTSTESTPEG